MEQEPLSSDKNRLHTILLAPEILKYFWKKIDPGLPSSHLFDFKERKLVYLIEFNFWEGCVVSWLNVKIMFFQYFPLYV